MGATIATLIDIGWSPISPFKWVDGYHNRWNYKPGTSAAELLNALKEQVEMRVWRQAAKHHNGKGLEQGADLTIAKKHIRLLRKKGQHQTAGLLLTTLSGGIWSRRRKAESNLVEDDTCPWCGETVQTDLHLIWTCPALCRSKNKDIVRSQ